MKLHFESETPARGIDVENGVVHGATICTAGIEAKGHGLRTDGFLLRQLLMSAEKKGTIGVGIDHRSGVKGIEFFQSHSDFPLLMDQLSTLGNTMGISASFVGDPDGGKARCEELLHCDVVCHPAAAPTGLFSARDEDDDEEERDEIMTNDQLGEMMHQLLDQIEELEEENAQLADLLEELKGQEEESEEDEDETDQQPVLDEVGARAGPRQYSADLRAHDFESRIKHFRQSGLDEKAAYVAALREFARQKHNCINL
jgi:hypothetical protein